MKGTRSSLLLLLGLLCGVFFTTGAANHFCLGQPDSLKKGQQCAGSSASCEWGTYCDDTGICSPSLEVDSPCLENRDCIEGSICLGPVGEKICVAYAGVGDICGTSNTEYLPHCVYPYECEGICYGGLPNDACRTAYSDNICNSNLECENSVCVPVNDGGSCDVHEDCKPTSFCDYDGDFICRPRKESGACNGENRVCAPGYACSYVGVNDDAPVCIKHRSRANGLYCDNNLVCSSFRCANNYCSAGPSAYDAFNEWCAEDEVATCNGLIYGEGPLSQCTHNPCYDLEKKFGDCIQQHCWSCEDPTCREYRTEILSATPGQCYLRMCEQEYLDMRECNGAVQLARVTFLTVFLGFLASFLSKKL